MQLLIERELHTFQPIREFRSQFNLPYEFSVSAFEPKDYTGLGRIDNAGAELNELRPAILDAIPAQMPLNAWLDFLPHLAMLFQNKLDEMNPQVGLKTVEIEYAVAGFSDVCYALVYAMIRARAAGGPVPTVQQVYADWLHSSVKISNTVHSYIHKGDLWAVQVVNHAYGRAGLIIWMNEVTHYVYDNVLGCPAEGFMSSLLNEVAAHIVAATI